MTSQDVNKLEEMQLGHKELKRQHMQLPLIPCKKVQPKTHEYVYYVYYTIMHKCYISYMRLV